MNESAREWIGMSDLMTGLMLVFLLLAVLFMAQSERESAVLERTNEALAETNRNLEQASAVVDRFRDRRIRHRDRLHKDLNKEFEQNLSEWDAEILSDNTIRFKAQEVLFEQGKKDITPKFDEILSDFFPRYIEVLTRLEHKNNIDEIRIVGHTSSEWKSTKIFEVQYLENMDLSQKRAFSVLAYCFRLAAEEQQEWLAETLRANGLAFAELVQDKGIEDPARSRRVEFKLLTKTEENVEHLLKDLEAMKK